MRKNPPRGSTAWELKISKGNSIPFDSVKPHQVEGLMQAKGSSRNPADARALFHKITDMPMRAAGKAGLMRFGKPKPFDCFALVNAEAYVAVLFYVPRGLKEVFLIDVDDWVTARNSSERKSLTRERAHAIASHVIDL